MPRTRPNIVITGTPGVGKSSHSLLLSESTGLNLVDVNQIVKDNKFTEEYDEALQTWVVDEDRLLDEIEPQLEQGGNVIDWHVCDLFPERLIDLVVVLRCENEAKLQENLDAEIMQVVLDDAREGYDENIVVELRSDSSDDIDTNIERITQWYENWQKDHPEGV
ncbi:Similar to Putative adenylate kinase HBR1; acc. no. Q8TG40 [Pyronema omphalodes CBS 100304]|uniref:Adenylate kinase isoenzyme 6 homolog n=1 Tax=Pyronema omphalodes (strain CBS 100304) TaxID=1076935 RepID=U4KVZ2_PYROM|nr:Similar to Putative adenylate kinase HBR1; acc. no. Q8TG40 [Pyronema omphalodes CBS 100304]